MNLDVNVSELDGWKHSPDDAEIIRFLSMNTTNQERLKFFERYKDGSFVCSLYRSLVYEINTSELRARLFNFYADIADLNADLLLENKKTDDSFYLVSECDDRKAFLIKYSPTFARYYSIYNALLFIRDYMDVRQQKAFNHLIFKFYSVKNTRGEYPYGISYKKYGDKAYDVFLTNRLAEIKTIFIDQALDAFD